METNLWSDIHGCPLQLSASIAMFLFDDALPIHDPCLHAAQNLPHVILQCNTEQPLELDWCALVFMRLGQLISQL